MASKVAERYPGEEHFVEGYVPQSMNAEYSSLHRSVTWIGMGCILSSLPFWGTFVFGLAVTIFGTHTSHNQGYIDMQGQVVGAGADFNSLWFLWGGLIGALLMVTIGVLLIKKGRKNYKEYLRTYGGHH
ncbi:hypothetical protein CSPHI_01030 [Corynebacterium sphenisci DSM 44792]|uniref:Uncharacterized protein n=1 Tax=Corynebacterium sphenisci DSM 44792 TaxID=1437874 RepID=A0A1L7CVP2_9CORY|nr:LPXTG cell wall anchor domain-containing protein [Corynebacterium sphenisci]APT89904.1 hypothetical protein CSPHI_01030 [Corynebacterium sphenisci DSM 44792]